jgi:V8-like Glu-specific endopeptidase
MNKHTVPSTYAEKVNVPTLHELAAMKDLPATEPVPAFERPVEYVFEIEGDSTPAVQAVAGAAGKPAHAKLVIKARGSIEERGPDAVGELVSADELGRMVADTEVPRAHRPKWLDLVYLPKLVMGDEFERFGARSMFDLRVAEQTSREWPWNCAGKIEVRQPNLPDRVGKGSGVMIGPNLMLTASHVMPWGTNNSNIKFMPAYRNGVDPRFGHAFVERWRGVRTADNDDPNGLDYVICKLNWRIGDRTGWMGSFHSTDDDFYEDRRWISVGYPSSFAFGERPAVEVNVRCEDVDNEGSDGREIETNRFGSKGWSGGPLWNFVFANDPRVVAVMSGDEKDGLDPRRNVHAGGKHLVDLVKFGFANWV